MDPTNFDTTLALRQLQDAADTGEKADPVAALPGDTLNNFGEILKNSLNQVNQLQVDAQKAAQTYVVGGPVELHQVMIATERAELSLELTMQIRNKLLQAYQEISRMGV